MIRKAEALKKELDELSAGIGSLNPAENSYREAVRRIRRIALPVEKYREYLLLVKQAREAEGIIAESDDSELSAMAREELDMLSEKIKSLRGDIELCLRELEKTPGERIKGVIVEIRSGAGGDEACLFAGDLANMYFHLAEEEGWSTEIINSNSSELGGFKEIIFALEGGNVWEKIRFEGGVHRVQRIPATESSGRIHTSTVTVAVLPEPEEEGELKIDSGDLRIDTYRASGAGGQHVNVTDSAVRITHLPTGVTVQCQDERSQHKNRAKAMRVLRARLIEAEREKRANETALDRHRQIKTGDRSQKIRTYNFPQNRVTDHRINFSLHKLDSVMKGNMEPLITALSESMDSAGEG